MSTNREVLSTGGRKTRDRKNEFLSAIKRILDDDVPAIILIKNEDETFRSLSYKNERDSRKINMIKMLAASEDTDQFFRMVFEDAMKNGHQSDFLKAMGISEKPGG